MPGLSERLAGAVRWACETEVRAMKPGNVSIHSAGHGMSARDFLASAAAIAGPLTAPGASVGERILRAVEATRAAVGCNTNLGIVLLAAPLVHAALRAGPGGLRQALDDVLQSLTVDDAGLAYQAIRLAQPGGLGQSPRHDVREAPRVTLLAAMQEAAGRDSIALQYATGYRDVFETGMPLARACRGRWQSDEWAAVAVYLEFLARLPDTLIARKSGLPAAQQVSREAAPLAQALRAAEKPEHLAGQMLEFDSRLKRAGLNPGTSADLTVASLLALGAEEALQDRFTGCGRGSGPDGSSSWDGSRAFSQLS
jgi:triphosphoribosyl-dephospho-CoA synthase